MLSRPSQRYYGPLRLPGQPGGDFGVCLIPVGWTPVVHWPGSPVVPPGTILACHPCSPGGPRVTWQRWWSPGHRSSPSGNGVDALTEVNEATPGFAARYGLRGCARPSDALVRELGVSGYPSHLPQATRARCPLPEPDFHRRVPEYPRHATGLLSRANSAQFHDSVFTLCRLRRGSGMIRPQLFQTRLSRLGGPVPLHPASRLVWHRVFNRPLSFHHLPMPTLVRTNTTDDPFPSQSRQVILDAVGADFGFFG